VEFPTGFVVLTGRNGAGKSTILDAIDFALTGTIDKFGGKHPKGGGIDKHIWWMGSDGPQSCYVRVGFTSSSGEEFAVTRSRDRGLVEKLDELASNLCLRPRPEDWQKTLVNTTLIRDETLTQLSVDLSEQDRFEAVRAAIGGLTGPDHSARTGELLKAANTARDAQSATVERIQSEINRALSSLTELRSEADKQPDVAAAEDIVRRLAPDLALSSPDLAEQVRGQVAKRKQEAQVISDLIDDLELQRRDAAYFSSDEGKGELQQARAAVSTLEEEMRIVREKRELAEKVVKSEAESDKFASQMAALLSHGEEIGLLEGHCPLCDAVRSDAEFALALSDARKRLEANAGRVVASQQVLRLATAEQSATEQRLAAARNSLATLEQRRLESSSEIEKIVSELAGYGLRSEQDDAGELRHFSLVRREETSDLERALFILEASSAHDRVIALEGRIAKLRADYDAETIKLNATQRAAEAAKEINNAGISVSNVILTEQFDTVMPLLKELYLRLRPHNEWREIETEFGGKVRASLNFSVGEGKNPQFLFSSGQRRAFGLSFLLAIHLSRPWARLETLLMDDPVQHIDDFRALNLVEVLSAIRQQGRQVVVAVEDPALADLLCRRLRSTTLDMGRRYDLAMRSNGSATIERDDILAPLPASVLELAQTS
jgi:DNA repair exonuclease SbcCD ATPase subunit